MPCRHATSSPLTWRGRTGSMHRHFRRCRGFVCPWVPHGEDGAPVRPLRTFSQTGARTGFGQLLRIASWKDTFTRIFCADSRPTTMPSPTIPPQWETHHDKGVIYALGTPPSGQAHTHFRVESPSTTRMATPARSSCGSAAVHGTHHSPWATGIKNPARRPRLEKG